MAHNINITNGKASFASKKQLAWHGLGQVVDAMTSEEAIKLGGLDYRVGLAPLYAGVNSLEKLETKDHVNVLRTGIEKPEFMSMEEMTSNYATYRKDTKQIFGIVGSRYEVIQNSEAFDFFDSIVGEGHATYETVGALGKGEQVFITAKLPNKLMVKGEDIDNYLLLTMAHDGSGAIQVMFTPIRVVCNNTLSAALRHCKNKVSIRHTKNARTKLELSKKILGIVDMQSDKLSQAFNRMAQKAMNDDEIETIIKNAFGFNRDENGDLSTRSDNELERILEYHEIGVGQETIRGTAWGVYNAITGYQQNVKTYKDADKKFNSIYDTSVSKIRQNAFNNLILV